MERISVTEAGRQFDELINRVSRDGVTIELEKDNHVIARLCPASRQVKAADLNRVFASLPSLGDDAESFARMWNGFEEKFHRKRTHGVDYRHERVYSLGTKRPRH